jgi:hypothetical protein
MAIALDLAARANLCGWWLRMGDLRQMCDLAVLRFTTATNFAVWMGWPAGPLNSVGRRPAAGPCAKIFNVFGGNFKSRKFVATWRQCWELGGGSREDGS